MPYKDKPIVKLYYSIREAREELNLTKWSFLNLCRRKKIEIVKRGKQWFIRAKDFEAIKFTVT